jgi:ABC-2 type transport system permease protein
MGFVGSVFMPVLLFVLLGRAFGPGKLPGPPRLAGAEAPAVGALPFNLAILTALVIAINAAQSLIAIMSIYREGGILKRLRATPLSPVTILASHVMLKLAFTTISLTLLVLAGQRLFPGVIKVNVFGFGAAVLLGTLSILSLGFVLASLVPTPRFAQLIGAVAFYPMLALSGLFFPVERLPVGLRATAFALPTTHAVALLQGVWDGSGWIAHWVNAAMLLALFGAYTALSTKVFRWE